MIDDDFDPNPLPAQAWESAKPVPVARIADTQSPEEYLIGCCMVDEGVTLDRCIAANLASTDFTSHALATIYGTLRRMRREGTPIATDTLAAALGPHLAEIGLPTILALDQVGTTARAEWALGQVIDAAERRRVERIGKQIAELTDLSKLPELVASLQPRATTPATDFSAHRITLASKPVEPTTRLFLAGKPIATPGNIVSIISKAKTGKTATIGGVVAAIIGAHFDRPNLDTFGFTAPHTKEAVVLIDTEQSPYDAFTCHQRAFSRAGQDADVDWFHHYALVGMSADALRKSLPQILAKAKAAHGAVFTLILDGVADLVNSVNDEAECNGMVTWLRALAVEFDCPIICVIHSNEAQKSGDDGRGHLGKQLTRKAESNLLLKKEGDITVITSEKQRKAPITEADGIAFQWSDEHGRHVSVKNRSVSKSTSGRPAKYDPQEMLACFPGPTEQPRTVSQVHRIVGELPCGISIRGFKDVVAKLVETGELERVESDSLGFTFRRRY